MLIIPKETPIISDLNSYYLRITKLFEHYQGVVDSGCIYFKSPSSEGVVFFDEENLINGIYQNKKTVVKGKKAIDLLMGEADINNFLITIYEIRPERITFWANIGNAEDLHKDLSTEFTDLEGLIKKMTAEKLTGLIEVRFQADDIGIMFYLNGEFIGASSSAKKGELMRDADFHQKLIERSRQNTAMLNVKKVVLKHIVENYSPQSQPLPQALKQKTAVAEKVKPSVPVSVPQKVADEPLRVIEMLQQLMFIFERFITGNRKIKDDFDTILRRKFMLKLDKYEFLDPFAADFSYSNGKIDYAGQAELNIVAKGLIECLKEISDENKMQKWLMKHLLPWNEKYSREISTFKIEL